jgi:hypothetical protein
MTTMYNTGLIPSLYRLMMWFRRSALDIDDETAVNGCRNYMTLRSVLWCISTSPNRY